MKVQKFRKGLLYYTFFLIFGFHLKLNSVYGQTDLNCGFGEIKNTFGEVSCSLGIFIGTQMENSEVSILFGIQQPYDTDNNSITSNPYAGITIFPNPVENTLVLRNNGAEFQPTSVQISNTLGQLVYTQLQISDYSNTLNVSTLTPGGYILTIYQFEKPIKTFKFNKL
jgi:hypothetical protein